MKTETKRQLRSKCKQRIRSHRPLRIELLESRDMLSITVNTLVDENNGVGSGAGTSLREAIATAVPGDTIAFSVTGTINLTLGQLQINKDLSITGPGANLLTVDASGNDPTPAINNGDGSRVFQIDDGQSQVRKLVSISGIRITGGDITITGSDPTGSGAGIRTTETLTLTNCVIDDNHSLVSNGGGGIFASSTAFGLTITDCTISGNTAPAGAGIYYK